MALQAIRHLRAQRPHMARQLSPVGNAVIDDVVVDVAAIGAAVEFDIHHVPTPCVADDRQGKGLPDRRYARELAPVCKHDIQRASRSRRVDGYGLDLARLVAFEQVAVAPARCDQHGGGCAITPQGHVAESRCEAWIGLDLLVELGGAREFHALAIDLYAGAAAADL